MKAQFEKISTKKNALHAFVYIDKSFDAPWHYHPEYELTYIVSGQGMRYVGNSIQKFEEGDFVLLGPNLPHCWKDTNNTSGNVKSLVFQWNDNLFGADWTRRDEFHNIKKLLNIASKGIKFNSPKPQIKLNSLLEIIRKPPLDKLLSFLYLLEELYLEEDIELLTTTTFTSNLNLKANNRIDKIYNYVENHCSEKIKLNDVSNLVSMSNEAFCRFFKKTLHKSFFTFVNEYRINLACKMLIETNKQVGQIAYECGYESLPFFYRQFQKFIKCSPLAFKKKYQ